MGGRRRRLTTADWFGTLIVLLLLPALCIPMLISAAAGPRIGLAAGDVVPGHRVTIAGERFQPKSSGTLEFAGVQVARYNVDRRGTFETSFRVPKNLPPGSHTLFARSGSITVASLVLISAAFAAQGAPVGASPVVPAPSGPLDLAEVASATSIAMPTQSPLPTPVPLPTPELIPTPVPLPTPAPVVTPVPVFVTPPPASTPTGPATGPAPPASAGVALTFGPSATAAQLVAAISDNSIDTIFLQPGTYHVGKLISGPAGAGR